MTCFIMITAGNRAIFFFAWRHSFVLLNVHLNYIVHRHNTTFNSQVFLRLEQWIVSPNRPLNIDPIVVAATQKCEYFTYSKRQRICTIAVTCICCCKISQGLQQARLSIIFLSRGKFWAHSISQIAIILVIYLESQWKNGNNTFLPGIEPKKNSVLRKNHRVSYCQATVYIGQNCKQKKVKGLKILTSQTISRSSLISLEETTHNAVA